MSEFNQARRDGQVKFGYDFGTLAEVTHLWGLTATKLPYSVAFKIPGRGNAIALLLSEDGGKGWKNIPHYGTRTDGRGWREIVRIDEVNEDRETSARRVANELAKPLDRYVFWRETRGGTAWYKFHGVFKLDIAETEASRAAGENVCIYRKVSDVAECLKSETVVMGIPDVDFAALKGVALEANLMDEIEYELDGKKDGSGTVKVWPKQRFLVREVLAGGLWAACLTNEKSVLAQIGNNGAVSFYIPKRDIELGYFRIMPDRGPAEGTAASETEGASDVTMTDQGL